MQIDMRIGRVRRRRGIFRNEVVVGSSLDFELAPVPGEDLGLDAAEAVGVT